MKKLLSMVLLSMYMYVPVSATSLVLLFRGGQKVYYQLADTSSVTMKHNNDFLSINADNYTFKDVSGFRISKTGDPTGIKSIPDENDNYRMENNTLYIHHCSHANLFNVNGTEINNCTHQDGQTIKIEISTLPTGIYLIKTNNTSFKFLKK